MTTVEMLGMVRRFIADEQKTGFTESPTGNNLEEPEGRDELLMYLDRAVDEYSKRLASQGDFRLMKLSYFGDGIPLPEDFIAFCGVVPIRIDNGVTYYHLGDTIQVQVKYFARLPYVTNIVKYDSDGKMLSTVLPYDNDQAMTITALAAIYALNKHEFNVSQDLMLLGFGAVQNGGSQQ